MTDDQVLEKLESLEEKIDGLQEDMKTVKGGKQPEDKLSLRDGTTLTDYTEEIIQEVKNGNKHNGLEAGSVETILDRHGFERKRKSVLNFMRKIRDEIPNMKFVKGSSTKGSELQFHPPVTKGK